MKRRDLKAIILTTLMTMTLISGCAKIEPLNETSHTEEVVLAEDTANTTETTPETRTEGTSMKYPLTIPHAFGETVLDSQPVRIVTIGWANQDLPLALGVMPVGMSLVNYVVTDDSGMLPWTKAKIEELGGEGPMVFNDLTGLNFEEINAAQPDVILAAYSGITEEEYNLLSEIAPVVAYPNLPWQTFWRDQIRFDAMGMGLEEEGLTLIAALEKLIQDKKVNYPELLGKSAAFFYFNPTDLGKFYVYLPSDPRAAYLTDLGMIFPDSVADLADESSSFALELSAENADLLRDIDVIVTYGTDGLLEILQGDALVGTIPAIANGAVAIIEDGTALAASGTPSALSIPATIDEYLEIINAAAKQSE